MKTLTITLQNDLFSREIDAFCERYAYKPEDGTKKQFVEQKLEEYLRNESREHRLEKARQEVTVEE